MMKSSNTASLRPSVDPKKDQGSATRRVLSEMNDAADLAIDEQVARSTPMAPKGCWRTSR
jgi:hypothetical protein